MSSTEKAEKAEARKIKALQRKAKKLAKDSDKPEEELLAELMAEAGLDESAEPEGNASAAKENKPSNAEADGEGRTVSAVLASHPLSRDVHIEQFTLLFHGHELLMDAKLELNHGR
jgi:ATP-binding cassette, subfamily F, member 2